MAIIAKVSGIPTVVGSHRTTELTFVFSVEYRKRRENRDRTKANREPKYSLLIPIY